MPMSLLKMFPQARRDALIRELTLDSRALRPGDLFLAVPGTRSMSPKDQKMTSGLAAMATALSISSTGVTHTGHPGPWMRWTESGSSSSRP